ncbi:MAG: lysophospholipid acyltransferase family protein [Thermodesulfobacteriota bacterium]|nr:lysophospholipid acyltransferase family protein [Thermodesulfobacteriota bacterium]
MFRKIGYAITSKPVLALLYRLIRIYSWTFKLKIVNEKDWIEYLENGGKVLICTWHQQFFSAIRYFKKYQKYHPSLMISRSKDGEIIAGVAQRTGWYPVRGSSSKGGSEALHDMISRLKKFGLAAHIVDGPRGPAGKVKPGAIRLAHGTGAVVVPFYASANRAWYLNSWDKFFLPKPFAKVTLCFGEMLKFDPSENSDNFEKQRLHLEKIMRSELRA